jgi:hypothetical protein
MQPIRYKLNSLTVRVTDQDNATVLTHIPSERPDDRTLPYLKQLPTFDARLNGGYGECVLDVGGWKMDDFAEGASVDHMNIVDIFANVTDQQTMTQASTRVYRGFVSSYTPYLHGGDEGVRITCLGLASLLTASKYGTATAYSVTQTAQDPEFIAKAIIDNFNAAFSGSLISYTGTTSPVGTNVTYAFTDLSWFDAVQQTLKLADDGWWWLVDAGGQFYFQDRPASVNHVLTFNLDIEDFEAPKTMEKSRNEIIVERSGGTRTSYTDATSQTNLGTGSPATGKWTEVVSDSSITNSGTADQLGDKKLAELKDPKVSARVTVNRMYNIDSIKPGDIVAFANFKSSSSFFGSNALQVVSMSWNGDVVSLELEQQNTSLARELESFVNPA